MQASCFTSDKTRFTKRAVRLHFTRWQIASPAFPCRRQWLSSPLTFWYADFCWSSIPPASLLCSILVYSLWSVFTVCLSADIVSIVCNSERMKHNVANLSSINTLLHYSSLRCVGHQQMLFLPVLSGASLKTIDHKSLSQCTWISMHKSPTCYIWHHIPGSKCAFSE